MKTFGLLGKDIDYSFSRGYFNDFFKKEKIDAIYKNFDLQKIDDLKAVFKNEKLSGMNVTIPYKEAIFPFLDKLSPEAKAIGAVNVVKFEDDGTITGYNSDYYGFKNSLLPLLIKMPKKGLILGTGGASKAIRHTFESLNIEYTFVSRTKKPGQLTYEELSKEIIEENLLIVNSTPLGTFPKIEDCPDIPYEFITKDHMLFDLVYNPEKTTFLQKGEEQGASILNGSRMLVLQAEKSWDIWNEL